MMIPPGYSFSKTLTSYLTELDIREEAELIGYAYQPESDQTYERFSGKQEFVRDYLRLSVLTRLLDMGKRASDASHNTLRNARFTKEGVPYTVRSSRVRFPVRQHIPKVVHYPSVRDSLNSQREALDERLTCAERRLAFGEYLNDDDRRHIRTLHEFLKQYELLQPKA